MLGDELQTGAVVAEFDGGELAGFRSKFYAGGVFIVRVFFMGGDEGVVFDIGFGARGDGRV